MKTEQSWHANTQFCCTVPVTHILVSYVTRTKSKKMGYGWMRGQCNFNWENHCNLCTYSFMCTTIVTHGRDTLNLNEPKHDTLDVTTKSHLNLK